MSNFARNKFTFTECHLYTQQLLFQDLMAAHFISVCSGELPTPPQPQTEGAVKGAHQYSLLGCDVFSPRHRAIADCLSLCALRMTEILEWALNRSLTDSNNNAGGNASASSLSKSIIGLFGLGGGSGGKAADQHTQGAAATDSIQSFGISQMRLLHVRSVLCPLKLRLAYILADFGMVKEAAAYATEARAIVQLCGSQGEKPEPTTTCIQYSYSRTIPLTITSLPICCYCIMKAHRLRRSSNSRRPRRQMGKKDHVPFRRPSLWRSMNLFLVWMASKVINSWVLVALYHL
jgi:hypothetical protein